MRPVILPAGKIPEGALVLTRITRRVGIVTQRDEGKTPGVVIDFGIEDGGEKVIHPAVLLEVTG